MLKNMLSKAITRSRLLGNPWPTQPFSTATRIVSLSLAATLA